MLKSAGEETVSFDANRGAVFEFGFDADFFGTRNFGV